jgi:hypothetical protein
MKIEFKRDLDDFVADVINSLKLQAVDSRQAILEGELGLEQYRKEAGVLLGMELAIQTLIDEANKAIRGDDDE